MYEDEKVQKFDSLTDGIKVCHDLTEIKSGLNQQRADRKSIARHLENCIIVKTEQDIAFDTEKVIATVRYGKNYYIQYRTDSDAQAAVTAFESYPTVSYAITDRMISYGVDDYVAGIIADCTQGSNVSILPIEVLEIEPWTYGTEGTLFDLFAGMQYAIAQGVDVINLSMGTSSSDYEPFCEEIDEAVSQGIVVVAASGNEYSYIGSDNFHPAHKTNIIVTAAVDSDLQDYHNGSQESNYGPSVDVTAPGVDVKSAFHGITTNINNKYIMKTGTSMAAPHISAAAAMLKLKYPNYSCVQIEEKLKSCAMDLGEPDYDQHYGAGLPISSELITSLPFYDVPVFFYHMSNSPFVEYRNIYNDVSSDSDFANAAVWAYDNGILTGYQDGNMGVDNNIMRQDFMLTLYRYANYKGLDVTATADISEYADHAQVSEYAYTAVSFGGSKWYYG